MEEKFEIIKWILGSANNKSQAYKTEVNERQDFWYKEVKAVDLPKP